MEDNRDAQLARLKPWVEKATGFSGWNLSGVEPRLLEPGPPWNYEILVRKYSAGRRQALDLGTGGGEFLARVRKAMPRKTVATEEWKVNAPIATRRLNPLGVDTIRCRSLQLPFANSIFDLVLDRHEELEPSEIARVLSPGGKLVTQQVGDHWRELKRFFPRAPDFSRLHEDYLHGFRNAGLKIVVDQQHYYKVAYPGLGEIVYLLCVAPWEVPGFSLEQDLDALLSLESELLKHQGLILTESRFLIIAEKPHLP